MSDTNNTPKLQTGNGFIANGNESPTTPTKLLLNHGKPNFTISQSTKFYGALSHADTTNNQAKNNTTAEEDEDIMPRVVLRRTQQRAEQKKHSQENDDVPEFILRQRAIQQRLAKENVLDFENRRSGYFTHVMITPTSPNRTSFVETMTSPAVVPALEIPNTTKTTTAATSSTKITEEKVDEIASNGLSTIPEEKGQQAPEESIRITEQNVNTSNIQINDLRTISQNNNESEAITVQQENENESTNLSKMAEEKGQQDLEIAPTSLTETQAPKIEINDFQKVSEEKVAQKSEESTTITDQKVAEIQCNTEPTTITAEKIEVEIPEGRDQFEPIQPSVKITETREADLQINISINISEEKSEQEPNMSDEEAVASAIEEVNKAIANEIEEEEPKSYKVTVNVAQSHSEEEQKKHAIDENNNNGHDITISHTKGELTTVPHIPSPDPSGVLGVNYETKTVVSFSRDLADVENKYPDTVQVIKEEPSSTVVNSDLAALTKVKFQINADEKDVEVIPVIKTE